MMGMPTPQQGIDTAVRRAGLWTKVVRPQEPLPPPLPVHQQSTPTPRLHTCTDRVLSTVSTAPMTTTRPLIPLQIRPTSLASDPIPEP